MTRLHHAITGIFEPFRMAGGKLCAYAAFPNSHSSCKDRFNRTTISWNDDGQSVTGSSPGNSANQTDTGLHRVSPDTGALIFHDMAGGTLGTQIFTGSRLASDSRTEAGSVCDISRYPGTRGLATGYRPVTQVYNIDAAGI